MTVYLRKSQRDHYLRRRNRATCSRRLRASPKTKPSRSRLPGFKMWPPGCRGRGRDRAEDGDACISWFRSPVTVVQRRCRVRDRDSAIVEAPPVSLRENRDREQFRSCRRSGRRGQPYRRRWRHGHLASGRVGLRASLARLDHSARTRFADWSSQRGGGREGRGQPVTAGRLEGSRSIPSTRPRSR